MHACPERNCKYRTQNPHRMELHKTNTGHGTKAREFRGHMSFQGGQKKKVDDGNKGKKGRR